MRRFLPAIALSAFVLAGCFKRPVVDEGDGSKTKTDKPPAEAKDKPAGPATVKRDSMEGIWLVQMSDQVTGQGHIGWLPMVVIKISKSPSGAYSPQFVSVPPKTSGSWKFAKADITDKTAHLVLAYERDQFDLQVTLRKTEALGNILRVPFALIPAYPARLLATTETRLERFDRVPHDHHADFDRAIRRLETQQATEPLDAVIKKYLQNPLSCFATYRLSPLFAVRTLDSPRPDPKEIRAHLARLDGLADAWGRRAVLLARLDLARNLARWIPPSTQGATLVRKNISLEIAEEIVRAADTKEQIALLNELQQAQLEDLKKYLELEQNALAAISTKDPQRRTAALSHIRKFLETAPKYVPWLMFAQAEGNRNAGNTDKAIQQYSRLVVMPAASVDLKDEIESRWLKMPDLQRRLQELWTKKTGAAKGLDQYLAADYDRLMHDLLPELVAVRPARHRKRIHLCEVFTSSDDPGCVGADMASQFVQRTYAPVDVIVLRYHLDVPQPNPLVCNDSKLRAFDCQVPTAPMILVNGKPLAPDLRRTLAGVPRLMSYFRNAIHSESANEPPKYQVRVTASVKAGQLAIKAEVDGPQQVDPDLRLRIVLAEDRIDYIGKNGIRRHEMVVRSMPAGIDGVPLKAGKTTHPTTVDLSDLSGRLRDFLTSLEQKKGVKLPVKPVDFRKLHVVAFVQSAKGRRDVLQVAKTVVGGLGKSANASK